MRRTLISFAVVLTTALPVSFDTYAGDNVFKEIGEDTRKLGGRMGKSGKQLGKDLGGVGKQIGKDFAKAVKDVRKSNRDD